MGLQTPEKFKVKSRESILKLFSENKDYVRTNYGGGGWLNAEKNTIWYDDMFNILCDTEILVRESPHEKFDYEFVASFSKRRETFLREGNILSSWLVQPIKDGLDKILED